jgi:hypothetical protein
MGFYDGPKIVTAGLILALDASDRNSYPGSGTTWYDVSGNNRHYTLVNSPTWNSGGYFTFDGFNDYAYGPAANTFGLGQEHTVEVIMKNTVASTTTLFNWRSSLVDREIMGHVPYSDGNVYYDVGGCCGGSNRINYTPSPSITNRLVHYIFRCRTTPTPRRQIFENNIEKVNSGANTTDTINLSSNVALIAVFNEANIGGSGGAWSGNIYSFRMYDRGLTDNEVAQNFNAFKSRFNL